MWSILACLIHLDQHIIKLNLAMFYGIRSRLTAEIKITVPLDSPSMSRPEASKSHGGHRQTKALVDPQPQARQLNQASPKPTLKPVISKTAGTTTASSSALSSSVTPASPEGGRSLF